MACSRSRIHRDVEPWIAGGADAIRIAPDGITADPGPIDRIQARGPQTWMTVPTQDATRIPRFASLGVDAIACDGLVDGVAGSHR